ncbi:bifunctional phosphoglucose/phosphomannose isomerase [Candidatus Bathyarchaeota archaeon]|nr:bifunctional phosphoglucose/phosphomannose isomerase [Candidatus Bathyarchaeota archaeon]
MKTSVLDSIGQMSEIDKSNMLSFCVEAPNHYEKAAKLAEKLLLDFKEPSAIIVSGMGGSAIGGELLKDWARNRVTVPIEVCRDYSLPKYADKGTLVFVVSYSGETEESLSAFLDALKRGCTVVSVSSGGKLQSFAEKLGVPHICVPSGMAPRATLPYLFIPLPLILEKIGLASNVSREISEATKVLELISDGNSPQKPSNRNFSKSLAKAIVGTIPVTYGFGFFRAVAQRFKTQFNENSKVPAKWEFFPELNHNEIVGWEALGNLAKHFSTIIIRDTEEPMEIRHRIENTKDLMQNLSLKIFEVRSEGRSALAKMCSVISVGDFTSVYLAILRGIDPTPVKTISLLKNELAKNGIREKVIRELQRISRK